jgi:L-ascorbate metabolism protein UlaG (beta-lactamase superfamily)
LIRACGKTVYHAGDLNWWHWEGEDPKWNAEMAEDYKKEIDKLKGIYIDIAFVPVDPRLGGSLLLGLDHLMRTAGVGLAVPMHYGSLRSAAARAISTSPLTVGYRQKVIPPMCRGQQVTV